MKKFPMCYDGIKCISESEKVAAICRQCCIAVTPQVLCCVAARLLMSLTVNGRPQSLVGSCTYISQYVLHTRVHEFL